MKKVVPYNLEAEMSVLGTIFLDEGIIIDVMDQLNKDDFYDTKNRLVFQAMLNLSDSETVIDYQTVCDELLRMASLENAGGTDYITSLIDYVPTTINIGAYINIVKDNSLKRNLIDAANDIANKGFDGEITSAEFIDYAEEKVFEFSQKRKTEGLKDIRNIANEVRRITEENMNSDGKTTGLKTGYKRLDEYTLGLHAEELIILAARPAMGKSAMAMNLAYNVARQNNNGGAGVAIFTLEMSAEQLVSRMLSLDTQIDGKKIRSGSLNANEWAVFNEKTEELGKLNIYFEDNPAVTVAEIRAKCRKLKKEKELDLVVIDYLQLIKGDGRTNSRQEEVSHISRSLKQMARELKVCVIALAQLSRKVEERDDKRPIMADLRESGSIEQDADIVTFLYRPEYYTKDNDKPSSGGKTELIISKNRQGTSGVSVDLMFQANYSRFVSVIEDEEQ